MLGNQHSHALVLSFISSLLYTLPFFLKRTVWGMAQTVQKKQQKRKQRPAAVEHPDSTPPAPKRVKVSQAQTARKSTGGREPPPRRAGGGGGGGGDDGDDSGDDGGGGGGGGPRAGPSKQRMWYSFSFQRNCRARVF
jgi:hypothetical protein